MKDEAWFQSINWIKACLECQSENNGVCRSRSCAEMHYDNNGNAIPASSIMYDGDYKAIDPDVQDLCGDLW